MANFKISDKGLEQKRSFIDQMKEELGKYGVITLILAVFTAWNYFLIWNAEKFIERADTQAEMNYKIGVLDGKMEILLQEKLNNSSNSSGLK